MIWNKDENISLLFSYTVFNVTLTGSTTIYYTILSSLLCPNKARFSQASFHAHKYLLIFRISYSSRLHLQTPIFPLWLANSSSLLWSPLWHPGSTNTTFTFCHYNTDHIELVFVYTCDSPIKLQLFKGRNCVITIFVIFRVCNGWHKDVKCLLTQNKCTLGRNANCHNPMDSMSKRKLDISPQKSTHLHYIVYVIHKLYIWIISILFS